jgi:hypothetical protein
MQRQLNHIRQSSCLQISNKLSTECAASINSTRIHGSVWHQIQFDASSWSTPQQFDVLPRAALFNVDVTTSPIYMLPYAPSEAYNNKLFTIPLSTVSRTQAACGVTPDGSITTILAAPNPLSFTGLLGYTIVDSTAGLRILGKMDKSSALAGVIVQYFKSEYLVSYPLGFAELVYVNAGSSTEGTFVSLSADNVSEKSLPFDM